MVDRESHPLTHVSLLLEALRTEARSRNTYIFSKCPYVVPSLIEGLVRDKYVSIVNHYVQKLSNVFDLIIEDTKKFEESDIRIGVKDVGVTKREITFKENGDVLYVCSDTSLVADEITEDEDQYKCLVHFKRKLVDMVLFVNDQLVWDVVFDRLQTENNIMIPKIIK